MPTPARGGDCEWRIRADPRLMQARDKVARQKRTIAGGADDKGVRRTMRGGPVERREHARERPRETRRRVGDNRQPERLEARGIAVGVEDEGLALRRKPRDDPFEQRAPAERPQRLVAAAHAPGEAAGEDDAKGRGMIVHADISEPKPRCVNLSFRRRRLWAGSPLDEASPLPHRRGHGNDQA